MGSCEGLTTLLPCEHSQRFQVSFLPNLSFYQVFFRSGEPREKESAAPRDCVWFKPIKKMVLT